MSPVIPFCYAIASLIRGPPASAGNWSLYTSHFSSLPLYAYYNPLLPTSILQTERELSELIASEGPFDGVLGYSGGAALAAQLIIRHREENPFSPSSERPFRFAVFINGATPLRVFQVADVEVREVGETEGANAEAMKLREEAKAMFLRPSAVRKRSGEDGEEQVDGNGMLNLLAQLKGGQLVDGTPFMSDGVYGVTRYGIGSGEEVLVDIPTLHVRSSNEGDPNHGLELLKMCEPEGAREYHHQYGHDFPRGRLEMKKIASLIRELADRA